MSFSEKCTKIHCIIIHYLHLIAYTSFIFQGAVEYTTLKAYLCSISQLRPFLPYRIKLVKMNPLLTAL